MSLILASGSPRRQELLRLITEEFTVHPVDAEETLPEGMPVEMAAAFLADLKASIAAAQFPEDIVIGCDTVVVLNDEIMGKPADRIDAYLDTGEPFDKAGAYGIQGKGALLVKCIEGDYFNVVGLPVAALSRNLKQFEQAVAHPRVMFKRPGGQI